jgi:alpha-glucosidase
MYFRKIHNPVNFSFPQLTGPIAPHSSTTFSEFSITDRQFSLSVTPYGEDVYRLDISSPKLWSRHYSQAELTNDFHEGRTDGIKLSAGGSIEITDSTGEVLLTSNPNQPFGVCGTAWLLQFVPTPGLQFYGMGEKNIPFERSGARTKFWNTDVWADFAWDAIVNGETDPMYVSTPYLVIKKGNEYIGVLVNNNDAVFMATPSDIQPSDFEEAKSDFYVGSPSGKPEIYVIVGLSLSEVTSKLQRLVGVTPLPPLWSLGHHQCRWGYASADDLTGLAERFTEFEIPNDGLWLDIDYMDGYRVFTFNKDHWPNPHDNLKKLRDKGYRVIPILDPGVKVDPNYGIYQDGLSEDVYCLSPEKRPFIGFVWPGATVFPDFSTEEGRQWWSNQVKTFASAGVSGAWLDMNDPAVGSAELDDMLFDHGKSPHATYHNQFALGMSRASHAGFLAAAPKERPFLLSRSGFISTSRYAAIWTGDNYANYHHLGNTISVSLNLALSGIPFNGPDVAGFGGDTTRQLAVQWYKAGFLFPFLRNHSVIGSRDQEPWQFDKSGLAIIRHYIRLRYKLLPYTYNLWIDQEELGAAVMRPLFYEFVDTEAVPLGNVSDQFMLGPALMHAPSISGRDEKRRVHLPNARWFSAANGAWIDGNQTIDVNPKDGETALFVRDGSIVPMLVGDPMNNQSDLSQIELHVFISENFVGEASVRYRFDDGASFNYRAGERTSFSATVKVDATVLTVTIKDVRTGYIPASVRIVSYGKETSAQIRLPGSEQVLPLTSHTWSFTGDAIKAFITEPFAIS